MDTPLTRLMVRVVTRMAREGKKPGYYDINRLSRMAAS